MSIVSGISGTEQITVHAVLWPACVACKRPNPEQSKVCLGCKAVTPAPRMFDAKGKPLGTIAYYNKNPFKRIAWKVCRFFKEKLSWRTV